MGMKNRLMAILAAGLVSIGGSAIAPTTPAQAALANCPVANLQAFCLYQRTDYSSSGVVEYVYSNVERNTCLPCTSFTTPCGMRPARGVPVPHHHLQRLPR